MNVLLTDRLSCPRCGPEFGLILLAERTEKRRVLEGRMGCPNCRDRFPVSRGFGDLRAPPRSALPPVESLDAPPAEATERLRALLGVAEGPGNLALVGPVVAHAAGLAQRTPETEVVAVDAAGVVRGRGVANTLDQVEVLVEESLSGERVERDERHQAQDGAGRGA
ncbi:MAG: hypothetical protein KY453_01605 [Gemmatimonadetes bacterium]|nr:hypothetical protein [Gemmatimonadota bacterium]